MKRDRLGCLSWALALILLVMTLYITTKARADDDRGEVTLETNVGGTNVGPTALSGGNISTRTVALANGLGDVDIAGCLGSTAWATPLVSHQKLIPNWACLAEFYFRAGQPDLFAMAMCNTDIRAEFSSEGECRAAHNFMPVLPQVVEIVRTEDDHEERYQQTQAELEDLKQQISRRSSRPAQPFIDAERRAKLEAVREKK